MGWIESAKKNLLPLSESSNFKIALTEWNYTGNIEDVELATEVCDLCNHPNIRYKFEITNKYSNNNLYVGSECICKFGILGISEDGTEITQCETVRQVNSHKRKFIEDKKIQHVLNSLILLSTKDFEFADKAQNFYDYYQERSAFTPKQLNLLIYKLNKNDIKYNKKCFKMIIKRDREKQQLLDMKDYQVRNVWDCMSTSQKNFYLERK